MKILIGLLLLSLPAAAQAAGMCGSGHGSGHGCGHAASALYAVLSVLGYWVLQHAAKETAKYVKRTGVALGAALGVIGLLGLLCGVGSHIKKNMPKCCPEQKTEASREQELKPAAQPSLKTADPRK